MGLNIVLAGASSGFGHLQAAKNIKNSLKINSPISSVDIVNVFDYLPCLDRIILEDGWKYISLHHESIYRYLHRILIKNCTVTKILTERYSSGRVNCLSSFSNKINVFIATHPIAVIIGSILKKIYNFTFCVVATDFVLHNCHINYEVDFYYVPPDCCYIGSEQSIGFARKRSFETGIPLSTSYWNDHTKSNETMRYKPTDDLTTVLISFGGSGLGANRHVSIINTIIQQELPLKYIILTGKNETFYRQLNELFHKNSLNNKVIVYPYVDNTAELMAKADIFIGKAGGLTLSEALANELPIGIIDSLPGQEDYNTSYIIRNKLGVIIDDYSNLMSWVQYLLSPGVISDWKNRITKFGRPNSSRVIAQHILNNITY